MVARASVLRSLRGERHAETRVRLCLTRPVPQTDGELQGARSQRVTACEIAALIGDDPAAVQRELFEHRVRGARRILGRLVEERLRRGEAPAVRLDLRERAEGRSEEHT